MTSESQSKSTTISIGGLGSFLMIFIISWIVYMDFTKALNTIGLYFVLMIISALCLIPFLNIPVIIIGYWLVFERLIPYLNIEGTLSTIIFTVMLIIDILIVVVMDIIIITAVKNK